MVQINFALREVSCKVVYYGPGMSGKTTNLEVIHRRAPEGHRGELTSIATEGDRTLFFDFMPLDLGTIAGMKTKFQLYTVPGQVYYNSTRKLVLQGVDGVVFVADSSPSKMEENLQSYSNLEENLREYGRELRELPHVIQWNKRDLPDALPVAELNQRMNKNRVATFEAVAMTGEGVFPTLKALASAVLESINRMEPKGRSA
ncbi:MAG: GTPase domain-containing protein, partial [Planctomycetes bacterium]|nr:GTPase domain-containing protein [Planctomycetota bacterium]